AGDRDAETLTKAAQSPPTLSGTPALQQIALALVASLIPISASAALIARSLQLQFAAAQVKVPGLHLPRAGWIGEGSAIPVSEGTTSIDAVLDPYKLGVIVELTGEMMRSSNAELLVRTALLAAVGPSLDLAMFSNAAGVPGVSPPGILNGVTSLTPTTGGGLTAMVGDVQQLADALAAVAGNGGICLIAAIKQSVSLAMLPPGGCPYPVFASSVFPAGMIIAVGPQALCSIVAAPAIEASGNAIMHEDPSALPIVVGGVAAHPVR